MAKDLKNKIKTAYESETPDLRERVLSACENEIQEPAPVRMKQARKKPVFFRRLIAVAACLILFIAGLSVGYVLPEFSTAKAEETCVYLDVNPSLELSLDKDNTVLSCTAKNADAETVLNGMQLKGVELKTALHAIVGSMYVNGYLTSDENFMLISVETKNADKTNEFLSYITAQVHEVFANSETECAIIAQGVTANAELKSKAEALGVSVGKMHLLDKMVGSMDDLTEQDVSELAEMSIKDLSLIYSAKPDTDNKPKDELISGSVNVGVTMDEAVNAVLNELEKTAADVETYDVRILPSKHGKKRAVYAVTLLLKDGNSYRYEVDFQTKKVTEISTDTSPNNPTEPNEPSKDHSGNGGNSDEKSETPKNEHAQNPHGEP